MSDLVSCSATDLARRIRTRQCSAVEVLEAHLDRIDAWNPVLNAVVTLDATRARERAAAADRALAAGDTWGPLHGVPVTLKDQFSTAGLRTTYGLPRYARFVPDEDAPLVTRLRDAGAVILGKTNLPFASYDWQCVHPNFGRTNNPWAPTHTPGGSSGGSAAALAAGFAPLELGADVGGSIRVPSHFCGVTGLRPTEGALPLPGVTPPDRPRTVHHIVVPGPLARTVTDLQLAWSALQPSAPRPENAEQPRPDQLRIAVTPELGDVPVNTDTQRVLRRVTSTLADAGCTVERQSPPVDVETALETWGRIQGYELTASLPGPVRATPLKHLVWQGPVRSSFDFLAGPLGRGARLSSTGYFAALERRDQLAHSLASFLTDWDLWITPVASIPAFPHQRTGAPLSLEDVSVPYALPFAAYNCATAVTGHPILTLPAGRSTEGLPIGMQVHARHGRDAKLLAAGRRLEEVLDQNVSLAPLRS